MRPARSTPPAIATGALAAGPQPPLPAAGGLLLRPWKRTDAPVFFSAYPDPAIQQGPGSLGLHDEASSTETTDWPQILVLYEILERLAPNPVATLNRAVAVGMVHGPDAGLTMLDDLESGVLAGHHRLLVVRAHLLERAGRAAEAAEAYRGAARYAGNVPEQRSLAQQAARCAM